MNISSYYHSKEKMDVYVFNLFLAKDVLNYFVLNKIPDIENYIITHYYPLLKRNDIFSLKTYDKVFNTLYKKNMKEITDVFDKEQILDSLFYTLYNNSTTTFNNKGVNYIKFTIEPSIKFKLNLENIFKLLDSSKEYPLSRINYGKSQDKLYRLYTVETTTDKKKIPYVDKSVINKVKKLPGRTNAITLYTEYISKGNKVTVYIDIFENCSINVTLDSNKFIDLNDINDYK